MMVQWCTHWNRLWFDMKCYLLHLCLIFMLSCTDYIYLYILLLCIYLSGLLVWYYWDGDIEVMQLVGNCTWNFRIWSAIANSLCCQVQWMVASLVVSCRFKVLAACLFVISGRVEPIPIIIKEEVMGFGRLQMEVSLCKEMRIVKM